MCWRRPTRSTRRSRPWPLGNRHNDLSRRRGSLRRSGYAPKNPIVPPVLVRKPAAPLECDPSAFWTALARAPTPAAWRPTADAYWRVGLGSYAGLSGWAPEEDVSRASTMAEGRPGEVVCGDESWTRSSSRASLQSRWRKRTAPSVQRPSNHSPAVSAAPLRPVHSRASRLSFPRTTPRCPQFDTHLSVNTTMDSQYQPWFRGSNEVQPFGLFTVLTVRHAAILVVQQTLILRRT